MEAGVAGTEGVGEKVWEVRTDRTGGGVAGVSERAGVVEPEEVKVGAGGLEAAVAAREMRTGKARD